MSRCLIVALVAVSLGGCTFATTLRHPDGRSVVCGPYPAEAQFAVASAMRESQCI